MSIFRKFTRKLPNKPFFTSFYLKDNNPLGGTEKKRLIWAPNKAMRIIHQRFYEWIRSLKVNSPFAVGSIPGESPLTNVQRHLANRFFYLTDISKAYKNVDAGRMALALCSAAKMDSQEQEALAFLKKYCFLPGGGLITGAPASPDLFNLYAALFIDVEMAKICEYGGLMPSSYYRPLKNLVYTRYLDDLTISSKEPIPSDIRKLVRSIIEDAGFKINHRKSAVLDLQKGPIVINGIGLKRLRGGKVLTFLPRHYMRKVKGAMHRALKNEDRSLVHKVHGMWGTFRSATGHRALNVTERKFLQTYREFQQKTKHLIS